MAMTHGSAATTSPQDADARSVSVRLDGRASIEHQLDIHVLDLAEATENKDISIADVLHGLRYVAEYRIRGGRMPRLDPPLMNRLARGLVPLIAKRDRSPSILQQRPSEEAFLALSVFIDLVAEVQDFRDAVIAAFSASDLRHALMLHRYCQPRSPQEHRQAVASVISLLMSLPSYSDWHDLVREQDHDDVERLMRDFPAVFSDPYANRFGTNHQQTISGDHTPSMQRQKNIFPPPALYFDKNSARLAEMFGSSIDVGLASNRIEELRAHYGINKLPDPPKPSLLRMLWTQITDFMVLILLVASGVQLGIGEESSAGVLLFVVVLNVAIGTTQEFKANCALEALMTLSVPKATVIRDGAKAVVDSSELVPGDLVILEEGDAVPADLRMCECAQLEIVEAILTGESLPVAKSIRTIRKRTRRLPLGDCRGNAFMTTVVAKGRGKGIVVRTGTNTEIGKISQAISATPYERSNIEKKLSRLGHILVAIAVGLCAIIVSIQFAYRRDPIEVIKTGISLAVSVIPEGLVAVVTVTMALGVSRMAAKRAIVRKLPSVETLGSVTVICSDKTGTLTEGKMGAQALWTSDDSSFVFTHSTSLDPERGAVLAISPTRKEHVQTQGASSSQLALADEPSHSSQTTSNKPVSRNFDSMPPNLAVSMAVSALCCNASIVREDSTQEGEKTQSTKWKPIGDPTEIALVVASQKAGVSREWLENVTALSKIGEYAFDSDRKLMSVIYQRPSDAICNATGTATKMIADTSFIFAKGAPESILQNCTSYMIDAGQGLCGFDFMSACPSRPLDDAFVERVTRKSSEMASLGLRVLALAMRVVSSADATAIVQANKSRAAESELCFVGLIGLIDPPKEGVRESVAKCHRAGIKVIMITGDHVATATAIARQLGIMDGGSSSPGGEYSRAMKGYEVDLLSEEQLAEQRPFPVVFARVSPDNKLKIVRALQSKKQLVAMTGDGVNDAPAIKRADVGVAMGVSGTEITKQAADIVLSDDNFSTIVDAVQEGRQVFDNIKKFVVYLLSCNSAEIFLFLIAAAANMEVPFVAIQILWANIIADIPPAMSIGLEPVERNAMQRRPRPANEGVLTLVTATAVAMHGIIMSVLSLGVYLYLDEYPLIERRTGTFVVLTAMQLVQSFLSRSVEDSVFTTGITGNPAMLGAFFFSLICAIVPIFIPPIAHWLEFEAFPPIAWAAVVLCVVVQIVAVELIKMGIRFYNQRNANIASASASMSTAALVGANIAGMPASQQGTIPLQNVNFNVVAVNPTTSSSSS